MQKHLVLLPGDGIGPEVVTSAHQILQAVAEKYQHQFEFEEKHFGASAIDQTGQPLPKDTLTACEQADAILLGAIGDPKYDNDPSAKVRPEQGLLALRKNLGLYANLRPVIAFTGLESMSPLRQDIITGTDLLIVRELTGGIYFGEPRGRSEDGTKAFDSMVYSVEEITRVARIAFNLAQSRRQKVTLVDKANVLATSRLWRQTVTEYAKDYADITFETMFVDNAAMKLIQNPSDFDVILTSNMFGDILSDEASVITGSLGLLPSSSTGAQTSLYEPVHGSYPQATGKDIANPIATILSAAMMLDDFSLHDEATSIRQAISQTLESGYGTEDLHLPNTVGTKELTQVILQNI